MTDTNTVSTSWKKMESAPFHQNFSSPIQVNNKEFVMITVEFVSGNGRKYLQIINEVKAGPIARIYKYNVDDNQWKKIFADNINEVKAGPIAFHEQSQSIYTWTGAYTQTLYRFNLDTQECTNSKVVAYDVCPQMVFVQNELHFITYCDKSDWAQSFDEDPHRDDQNHMVWNQQTNEIHQVSDFQHIEVIRVPHKLIYCKSMNCILIIGSHGIYEYSLIRKSWKKWTLKLPTGLMNFTVVTTRYNQYLLIIGGETSAIFIVDTMRKRMVKSKVKCPAKGEYEAFITNDIKHDNLLCFGYMSDCFKAKNMENVQILDLNIIQLISKWFCFQNVHIILKERDFWSRSDIRFKDGDHFKINIDDILESL